jgi:hypothetical protein
MVESPLHYTATIWNETHHYSLADGQLGYRFGDSDVSFAIALRPGGFSLHPRRQTHRYFRAGFVMIALSLFTLAVLYAKERSLQGIGSMLYVYFGMIVVGLALVVRFRAIYRAHLFRTSRGDEILIYRDPENAERADAFISRLNSMI